MAKALSDYNKKRSFTETPEPEGKVAQSGSSFSFVVQRHEATALHYDFRLELNGVMKSWAVPKGPSMNPKDRRLAVEVEDHPVSYSAFTGDIPEGHYGAGHVEIWDEGTYQPVDASDKPIDAKTFSKDLQEGHARFIVHGQQIEGRFSLVRTGARSGKAQWLLMKGKDEAAMSAYNAEEYPPISIQKSAKQSGTASAKKNKTETTEDAPPPKLKRYIHPMKARLHDGPFDDKDWVFEIKWDGYRAIAELDGENVKLYSRNGLSFQEKYPEVFEALRKLDLNAVLDGEIVALNKAGLPDFQKLQNAGNASQILQFQVFDLLKHDGENLEALTLTERKEQLKTLLPRNHSLIRYCDHVVERGTDFFEAARKQGMEGIIAKKKDSRYEEGGRSADWLKIKNIQTDEAIICGYTKPKGTRKHFGALILGMYEDGALKYIGHAGTGFDHATLKSLYDAMQPLVQEKNPFGKKIPVNDEVTWLKPELVASIHFSEITKAGIRRHPVYDGLRIDKSAREVTGADRQHLKTQPEPMKKAGRYNVQLTSLEKIWWPEEGYTKGDALAYYEAVAKVILPYLKDRPLSLKRNPNGILDKGFFHKDAGDHVPKFVKTKAIWSESSERDVDYIICNNEATLLYLVNMGSIELNPWHSRIGKLDRPDYLILDLDPAEKNTFDQVVELALVVKDVLDGCGADSYVKTSGSSGLHIYVPLRQKYNYEQSNLFAELVSSRAAALLPDVASIERSLKKRGQKIYVDYMQNNIAQTVAAPYSLRPRPHAPVSAPLEWKEVKPGLSILDFTIQNMPKRIEKKGDLFHGVLGKGVDLKKALKLLEAKG